MFKVQDFGSMLHAWSAFFFFFWCVCVCVFFFCLWGWWEALFSVVYELNLVCRVLGLHAPEGF